MRVHSLHYSKYTIWISMFLKNNITIIFSLSIEGGGLALFVFESKWAILTRQHSKICHDTLGIPIFNSCVTSTVINMQTHTRHLRRHWSSPLYPE